MSSKIRNSLASQASLPPAARLSNVRFSRMNPASFAHMKRTMLLAKPEQVLASSRQRLTKLRCSDLWSQEMKKEVVRVLWARRDSRVEKIHWRTKQFKSWKPPEEGEISTRIARYLSRMRSQDRPRSVLPNSRGQVDVCSQQLRACDRLRTDLHSSMRSLKVDRSVTSSLYQSFYSEAQETDLSDFIRDEVEDFHRKTQLGNVDMSRKSSLSSVAKRMKKLGLTFYVARRKRDRDR